MGLLIRLIVFLLTAFVALYAVAATVSLLIGLGRFLLGAPGAIRADLQERRRVHSEPTRLLRYVRNEAERDPPALPPGHP